MKALRRAAFANMCLSELLYNEPAFKVGCKLNGRHVTDAKSLYDCVVAENPNVSDKRSLVNVRSIQQTVSPKEMHWVPTRLMWADGLTKLDSSLLLRFSDWLSDPYVQLRDASEPTKIKTSVKMRLQSAESCCRGCLAHKTYAESLALLVRKWAPTCDFACSSSFGKSLCKTIYNHRDCEYDCVAAVMTVMCTKFNMRLHEYALCPLGANLSLPPPSSKLKCYWPTRIHSAMLPWIDLGRWQQQQ